MKTLWPKALTKMICHIFFTANMLDSNVVLVDVLSKKVVPLVEMSSAGFHIWCFGESNRATVVGEDFGTDG